MQSAMEYEASVTIGNIRVAILKADIANLPQKVDVIVTTGTARLDHSKAAASKAIANKAGKGVQREIQNQKHRLPLSEGDLIVTSGGNLACVQLYHVTLEPRKKDHAKVIKATTGRCLEEADLSSRKSIAFPALGTGNLNYPKRDVARAMFEAVEEYSNENPSSSVGFVYFVIFHTNTDVLTEFKDICKERADIGTRPFMDDIASLQKGGATIYDREGNNYEKLRSGNKIVETRTFIDDSASLQVGGRSSTAKHILKQDSNQHLCDETWFFGNISRKDAEEKLLAHPDGVYLVRESETSPGCYVISLREHDGSKQPPACVKHYKIQRNENDMFYITRERSFKSVQQLIKDCKESGVHRKTLVAPCPRASDQEDYGQWEIYADGDSTPGQTEQIELRTLARTTNRQHSQQSNHSRASMKESPVRLTPDFCSYMYKTDICPPPYWTKFTAKKSVKEWNLSDKGKDRFVLIQVDEETFQHIEGIVQDTWNALLHGHGRDAEGLEDLGNYRIAITRIQRVENLSLYEQYASRRQMMFYESGKAGIYPDLSNARGIKGGSTHIKALLNDEWTKRLYSEVNEEYLLHGTKPENVESVYTQGLDPRLARKAVLGPAVYMAESSTKADQYTDSIEDRQLTGLTMFLVRACLGNICGVTQCRQMRRPPCTDSACSNNECTHVDRYDSVVAEEQFIFREFVVYDRNQVYPEYVISYDRV